MVHETDNFNTLKSVLMKNPKKTKSKSLQELQDFNNGSFATFFCSRSFQRKYRKFYKFSFLDDNHFSMSSKVSLNTLKIVVESNYYFKINYTTNGNTYNFKAYSAKELISKIIRYGIY